jgi:hypothetical protein
VSGNSSPLWQQPNTPPLNCRVLDHALGAIVHSHYAGRLIGASHPHLPVTKLNLPVPVPEQVSRTALKQRHGLAPAQPVVAVLGFVSGAKRVEVAMRAMTALREAPATFLIVGDIGDYWRDELRRAGLSSRVRITGYVDDAAFDEYCRLADICLDLRYPTVGESSATCCRVMAAGGVCMVSKLGWYSELPDECVMKLASEPGLEIIVVRRLTELIGRAQMRERIGNAARRHVGTLHRPADTAAGYISFVDEVRKLRAENSLASAAVCEAGRALADPGIEGHERWAIGELARDLAGLGATWPAWD